MTVDTSFTERRRARLQGPAPLSVVAPAVPRRAGSRRPVVSRKATRANSALILLGLSVAAAVVFGLVVVNIALAQSSFQLSDLQKRSAEQQTLQRRLRYEVARAESPERIAQVGVELGLVAPVSQQYMQGPAVLVSSRPEPEAGTAGYELQTARP